MIIGIDIGGTNTKIALVSDKGECQDFIKFETHQPKDFESYIAVVFDHVRSMSEDHTISGIGIGAPNANSKTGQIVNPPNLKWGTVDFVNECKKHTDLPIFLENDANIAAIGEKVWGNAKELDDFIVVTLGTGVGTGIFSNGQLLNGSNGLAAEGGHITILSEGRMCGCGQRGHLEAYASVRGIKETAKSYYSKEVKFRELYEGFVANDPVVIDIFKETARYLAMGIATMANILGPKKVFLAGGIAQVGESFTQMTEDYLQEFLFHSVKGSIKLETSEIARGEGAVLGASALVKINNLLKE